MLKRLLIPPLIPVLLLVVLSVGGLNTNIQGQSRKQVFEQVQDEMIARGAPIKASPAGQRATAP